MALVVRLRSSTTDADVRPLAVPMGARVLLKIVADLPFMETFLKMFTKFHRELHEVLEVFGLRTRLSLDLSYVSSGSFRLSRLSNPERELKVREERVELDQ